MAHTGMGGMAGMEGMTAMNMDARASEQGGSAAGHGAAHGNGGEEAKAVPHGPDDHGIGNSAVPAFTRSRLDDPGAGLGTDGRRVLVYADLKSLEPNADEREPGREIELHLTGNMERYIWGFDGKKYSEAKTPIAFRYGERLRLTLVNDTMMEHPIHLHGMWMELENGAGPRKPRKHTVSVKPAERVSVTITPDAPGRWALHCHLLLHMDMGMFRVVEVSEDAVNPEHRGG
jgi:FtsP/CotA-like multicopper oxidase with cupredoxin domain